MKRLLKTNDAKKLAPSGLSLNTDIVKQAIETAVNNPTYGGMKEFVQRDGANYASYGLVSDDDMYIFESYEFINHHQEKWCAIVVAPVAKILDGTISAGDLAVAPFKNEKEIYLIGDIEARLGGVAAVDGNIPTFNKGKVNILKSTSESASESE